jgi:aspartate racemase
VKTLGLIGGISWLSTAEYYRIINMQVNARLGALHSAKCILHSIDMEELAQINKRQDWEAQLELVTGHAQHLKRSGAEALVLCSNTIHMIAERLERRVGIPLIHIADATAAEIRRQGLERVALLGTRFTMEMAFFRDRLAWHGVTAVSPDEAEREFIHNAIFTELAKNVIRAETRARFVTIIDRMATQEGIRGAILGCTEIPLLLGPRDAPIPLFDTTQLHATAAVDFALS